jgi:serine protease Do
MEAQTKTNANKTKTIIIVSVLAIAAASMGWYAKSNWFKAGTPAATCNLSQTNVYDKYKFAVPIIFTEYVYEVSIKGSAPVAFTQNINGDWDLYNEYTSPLTVSGTAFFVSDKGQLVTNKHVVEPWSYNEESSSLSTTLTYFVKADVQPADIKSFLLTNWENRYQDYEGDGEEVETTTETITETPEVTADATETTPTENNEEDEEVSDMVAQAQTEATPLPAATEGSYITVSDIKITPKRVRVYIAMHGTEITPSSIIPCKVINLSSDNAIDVALIQTKDKKLPKQVKDFIHLDSASTADQNIKPGTKAYMLGYPMGTTLASTKKGIRVQIYEGQVNKESDGTSLQYNITSTHGASGSPVINDCGQLIAVNYAGFDEAQGFNFGIVAKHALELYNDQ